MTTTMHKANKKQSSRFRVYYYFLLGAFGGVTGWFITALAFRDFDEDPQSLFVKGIILGALIGLSIAIYDGIVSRSFRRFFKFGGIGLLLGAVGGGASLPLGQFVFENLWLSTRNEGAEAYPVQSVGSSRVDLQACKLEYSIVSPK